MLVAGTAVSCETHTEGIMTSHITVGPSVDPVRLDRPCMQPTCGVSPWVKWTTIGMAAAQCTMTEVGFARLDAYGRAVGTRVRNCSLNLGTQIGSAWLSRWLNRRDADALAASTLTLAAIGVTNDAQVLKKIVDITSRPAWQARGR